MHIAHKPITTLQQLLTNVKNKDRLEDTSPNAATARLLTFVRPAETLARDWLNTNE